jgi:hypothetical protein
MKTCILSLVILSLTGCSSLNVTLSDEKTNKYRTFASIDPSFTDQDFEIRKRDRNIMAETTLFKQDDWSAQWMAGRHREQKWMTGVVLRYEF